MGTCEREVAEASGRRGGVRRFEDLEVWQTARQLAKGVYRAARAQKLAREPALADQMKRAAISVVSNIAEGYERGTRKQHIEFCYVAKGSAGELRAQVVVARDVELLDKQASDWLLGHCEKCSCQLARYLQHLQQSKHAIRGLKFSGEPHATEPHK